MAAEGEYQLQNTGQQVQQAITKSLNTTVPTKTSDLTNDSGFITAADVPTKTSQLTNDSGFVNNSQLTAEAERAAAAETALGNRIGAVEGKIPAAASAENQLADKAFVNSSIATDTATFRGTYNLVSDLELAVDATTAQIATALAGEISTVDNNDYCFVQIPTSASTPTEIARIDRYKYASGAWAFEFSLNNSGFTADQWAAINSGIASADVTKLRALPTNAELTTLLGGKVDKVAGKGLSTNDYTTEEKTKLAGLPGGTELDAELDKKANKDGWYSQLVAGFAENLVDTKGAGTEQEIIERTSCGSESIADDGSGVFQEFRGKSVKWNQLVTPPANVLNISFAITNGHIVASGTPNDSATVTFALSPARLVSGHKYYFKCVGTLTGASLQSNIDGTLKSVVGWNKIVTAQKTSQSSLLFLTSGVEMSMDLIYQVYDLTAIFGSGNEPTTVAAFEEWRDANLPKLPYYPYTGVNGVIINNVGGVLVTDGFQQYNPDTGKVNVLGGNQYQITGAYTALTLDGTTITPDSNGLFTPTKDGELVVTGGNSTTTCVHFTWSGYRNGEYEPYWQIRTEANWKKLYGKLNGTGSMVQFAAEGGKAVDSFYDVANLVTKEANIKMNSVDLGSLTWTYDSGSGLFYGRINDIKLTGENVRTLKMLCSKYQVISDGRTLADTPDKSIFNRLAPNNGVLVKDSAYSDPDVFKTAMSGVSLVYPTESWKHYTDLKYSDDGGQTFYDIPTIFKVADFGTERIEPLADNSGNPATTAFRAVIKYNNDFTREIVNLPKNYVKATEAQTFSDSEKARARTNIGAIGQSELEPYAKKDGVEDNLVAGAAKSLYGDTVKSGEFVFRQVQGGSGLARFKEVKGNSVVWNQLQQKIEGAGSSYIYYNNSNCSYSDGVITMKASAQNGNVNTYPKRIYGISGHKYLMIARIKGTVAGSYIQLNDDYITVGTSWSVYGKIINGANSDIYFVIRDTRASGWDNIYIGGDLMVFDLTQMSIASQISTAADFLRLFPLAPYAPYNAGVIKSNTTTAMEHRGFNQWDEEWELGSFNNVGEPVADNTRIRSKNYIPVLSGLTYYFRTQNNNASVRFYDASKAFIGPGVQVTPSDPTALAPDRATYMKFHMADTYGTTYKNDICINLSDPSRNGTYEPYSKITVDIPITTMTGKVNGEGESKLIFGADGAKKAGTVYDSLIVDSDGWARRAVKRLKIVDLGTPTWTAADSAGRFYASISNIKTVGNSEKGNGLCTKYNIVTAYNVYDKAKVGIAFGSALSGGNISVYDPNYTTASAFETAMSGVPLIYELSSPIEYVLDTPIYLGYQADSDGTEMQLPQNEATPTTAPLVADIIYAIDAIKQLNGLPVDYQSQDSMDAFLAALGTAMNGTWTKTWDASTGKYNFTFTPNA